MKQKALNTLRCAKLLIDKKFYTNSIHCSYYAVYQMILWVIEDIEAFKDHNKGSARHNRVINAFVDYFDLDDKVRGNIFILKNLRKRADYEDVKISEKEATKAYKLAQELIQLFQTLKNNAYE